MAMQGIPRLELYATGDCAPGAFEAFLEMANLQGDGSHEVLAFPYPVVVDAVTATELVEIADARDGGWKPFKSSDDSTRLGLSRHWPTVARAVRVTRDGIDNAKIGIRGDSLSLWPFAKRTGLPVEMLAAGIPEFSGYQGYRVINGSKLKDGIPNALAISRRNGSFGNNFIQLMRVVRVAEALGVRRIYVPDLSQFEVPSAGVNVDAYEFVGYDSPSAIAEAALLGTFFYKHTFESLQPSRTPEQEIATTLRQLLVPLRGVQSAPLHHVAIHIRSGDLFDRPNPHPRYPQPPLAYYVRVLEELGTRGPSPVVALVFQDKGNPTIDALARHLDTLGIKYEMHSSTLEDDLRVLLSHQTLVFGRGTFGKAVTRLSPHVREVFYPWTDLDFGGIVRERNLTGHAVTEVRPTYTRIGEWKNSPEQRELMLEYPVGNLELVSSRAKSKT